MTGARSLLWLAALLLAGCPRPEPAPDAGRPDAPPPPGARIELGTGQIAFAPVADGAQWELVAGPQGGFHLDVSVRLFGLDPERLELTYALADPDGTPLAEPQAYLLSLRRVIAEGDHFVRLGDRVVFDATSPEGLVGRVVVVEASAYPAAAGGVSDRRTTTVVDVE